jgi:ABC-2 type transport system permease protein
MRTIWSLLRLTLTQLRHDRSALLSMTVLPIVLTILVGSMFGGSSDSKLPVAFVDLDTSAYSRKVLALLAKEKSYTITKPKLAEAEKNVADNKLAAVVVVPKGFGAAMESTAAPSGASADALTVEIIESNDPVRTLAVVEVVRGITTRLSGDRLAARVALEQLGKAREALLVPVGGPGSLSPPVPASKLPPAVASSLAATFPYLRTDPPATEVLAFADKLWADPPISVKLVAVKAAEERGQSILATGFNQSSLGMTVWFVLMLVLGSAEELLEERENGTLPRLLTTPNPRSVLLGGKVAGVYSIGAVQAAILISVGALAFGVDWGSDPAAVLLIMATYTLAATGLAIMVAAVVRTRSQAAGLGPVLAVGLSMLGGCAWPLEIVPPFMKVVALFTPTGWAMHGLTNVVVRNQGIEAAIVPSLVLLGFSAVFFAIGLTRFRWE